MSYDIDVIDTPTRFALLEGEWNDLLTRSPCNLAGMRHENLRVWWAQFAADRKLSVVTIREAEKLVFAIPLLEEASPLLGLRLRSLTNKHSFRSHYLCDPASPGALQAFLVHLRERRQWDFLEIADQPADREAHAFCVAAQQVGLSVGIWQGFESPYLTISGRWEDHLASLSADLRKKMRRSARRLAEMGPVDVELIRGGPGLDDALQSFFVLETSDWKLQEGSAIICSPALRGFYRGLAHEGARTGTLRLLFLRVGSHRIAAELCFLVEGRLCALKVGYDPHYAAFSPGLLLTAEILARCHEGLLGDVLEYDFLGPASRDNLRWRTPRRRVIWTYVYNRTPRGAIHRALKFRLRGRDARYLLEAPGDSVLSRE